MPSKNRRTSATDLLPVPVEQVARRIYLIREKKVMIDSDLAALYQVETFNLNKAVQRNRDRFPEDFMFQLTKEEAESLRFQIGMSKPGGRGGRRYLPYAFTEHGVAMLSSVLRSKRAVQMNIVIVRAFVKLREILATNAELAHRLEAVERAQQEHGKRINQVYVILKQLIDAPAKPKRPIGFQPHEDKK